MLGNENRCYILEVKGFNNLTISEHAYYKELIDLTICFTVREKLENSAYDFFVSYNYDIYSIENTFDAIGYTYVDKDIEIGYKLLTIRLREIVGYELDKFHMFKHKNSYILNVTSTLINNYSLCICFNRLLKDHTVRDFHEKKAFS